VDSYENRKADTGNRKEFTMTRPEFRRCTFQFGIRFIRLADSLPNTAVAQTISQQIIRAAISVGANYRAAIRSKSRADFISKMGIVEEECDEAVYWIEVILELGFVPEKRTKELLWKQTKF
jgi:four helix bundle protein